MLLPLQCNFNLLFQHRLELLKVGSAAEEIHDIELLIDESGDQVTTTIGELLPG